MNQKDLLDGIKARAALPLRTGINVHNNADVQWLIEEVEMLRDWKAGATGAATIMYPPRTGPHTEEAYCAHKAAYERGTEEYRNGADVIGAAYLAAKDKWEAGYTAARDLNKEVSQ